MELPHEGKYVCKLNGQLVIYEAATKSLCCAVPCVMVDSGFTLKHTLVLVKADGMIQTKTTELLKTVFGWDGIDPFWLMDESADGGALRLVEFEIVGGPETGGKGGQFFKSRWLNPLSGLRKLPAAADRRSVLAKYGNKFQALAGSTVNHQPSATQGKVPGPPATKSLSLPKVPPVTRSPGGPSATMEEAWEAHNHAQGDKPAEAIEKTWFDAIARLFPNKSNTDLKPHEWGKLKAEFEDEIPM
ncbi:MAG: hypothetical protein QOF48_924 [Verrucomicrobiota bacterium]